MTFLGGSNVFRRSVLQAMGGQRPELKWHRRLVYVFADCKALSVWNYPAEMARLRKTKESYSEASRQWTSKAR